MNRKSSTRTFAIWHTPLSRSQVDPGGSWRGAFSLVEIMVAVAVLTLLILLVALLISHVTQVTTHGEKRMDSDAEARAVLDRMTLDIGSMLKRPDLDYFVKSGTASSNPTRPARIQPGNDQIAFFAEVPGYFTTATSQSPLSLVGYRVKQSRSHLERLGKGLAWNGASSTVSPILYLPLTIEDTWPSATNQDEDPNGHYALIGPQVFRFEYGYLLNSAKRPDGSAIPSTTSVTPWNTTPEIGHTTVHGFQDVAALMVYLAIIDPKSEALVTEEQLADLAAAMMDFEADAAPGSLEAQWQSAIDNSALPPPVRSSIRIYQRNIQLGADSL